MVGAKGLGEGLAFTEKKKTLGSWSLVLWMGDQECFLLSG